MPVSSATTKPNRRKRDLLETTAFPGGAVPLPSSEPKYVTQQEHEEKGTSENNGVARKFSASAPAAFAASIAEAISSGPLTPKTASSTPRERAACCRAWR